MLKITLVSYLLSFYFLNAFAADNLLKDRIRQLIGRKKSIYLDQGIFHNGQKGSSKSILKKVRESFLASRGYERIVLDFSTAKSPQIYGKISTLKNKIYIDCFNTKIDKKFSSFDEAKYIDTVDLYPITDDILSIELNLKRKVVSEIFYLENPARLVIDLKK